MWQEQYEYFQEASGRAVDLVDDVVAMQSKPKKRKERRKPPLRRVSNRAESFLPTRKNPAFK